MELEIGINMIYIMWMVNYNKINDLVNVRLINVEFCY